MPIASSRGGVSLAVGLVVLAWAVAALMAPAAKAKLPPPERLDVERQVLALPPEVDYVQGCSFTHDGSGLLCNVELKGQEGRHVGAVRRDGSRFRCLTCVGGMPDGRRAHKVFAFPDGRRFLLGALPAGADNADEGASLKVYVGECERKLPACGRLRVAPVELPAGTGSVNDREVRISPDGRKLVYTIVRLDGFLVLMGDLVRSGDGYEVRDARVLNPAPVPTTAADWARRGAFAEAKSFRDGRTLVVGSTEQQGSNLDVYRLDLATGAVKRVTTGGEWDEDADYDPRNRYLAVGTTRRNYNTLSGATVVPLPPFLDAVKTVFFARFKLGNPEERRRALEPWVTDERSERGGRYGGRQLSDQRGGWDGRMPVRWSPDGTRIVWTDHGPGGVTRLVVARLPGLDPVAPRCAHPDRDPACRTPTPEWAPSIQSYPVAPPGVRTIPGPGGGLALVTYSTIIGGEARIDYRDYTTADGLVLNGTEQGRGFAFRDLRLDYDADVRVSGRRQGRYRADVFGVGNRACGSFEGRLGDAFDRTIFGWTDPMCGFPPPPVCANRRDDDGDGLEDSTDRGCAPAHPAAKAEQDDSEAGPPRNLGCVPRAIRGTGTRVRSSDGALAIAVPGTRPVDVAVLRFTKRGGRSVMRLPDQLVPVALSPGRLRAGTYVVSFRAAGKSQADVAVVRNGRFRPAGAYDRAACGLLRRARLSAPIARRRSTTLSVRTRAPACVRVDVLRGRRLLARRALFVGGQRALRLPARGQVRVRIGKTTGVMTGDSTVVVRAGRRGGAASCSGTAPSLTG